MNAKIFLALILIIPLASCAFSRAKMAKNAQKEMVGMSKEQVLSCMGEEHQKNFENNIEVWEYSKKEYCLVNIAFNKNKVASVSYRGNTGWLPVKGEKCAYAIENCVRK